MGEIIPLKGVPARFEGAKIGIWIETADASDGHGVATDAPVPLTHENLIATGTELAQELGRLLATFGILPPRPDNLDGPPRGDVM